MASGHSTMGPFSMAYSPLGAHLSPLFEQGELMQLDGDAAVAYSGDDTLWGPATSASAATSPSMATSTTINGGEGMRDDPRADAEALRSEAEVSSDLSLSLSARLTAQSGQTSETRQRQNRHHHQHQSSTQATVGKETCRGGQSALANGATAEGTDGQTRHGNRQDPGQATTAHPSVEAAAACHSTSAGGLIPAHRHHEKLRTGNSILSRRASTPAKALLHPLPLLNTNHQPTSPSPTRLPQHQQPDRKSRSRPSTPRQRTDQHASTAMDFSHSYNGYSGYSYPHAASGHLMSPASISDDAESAGMWSVAASPMHATFSSRGGDPFGPAPSHMQRSQSTPFAMTSATQSLPGSFFERYGGLDSTDELCEDALEQEMVPMSAGTGGFFHSGRPHTVIRHASESGQGGLAYRAAALDPTIYAQQQAPPVMGHLVRPAGVMHRKRKPTALNTSMVPAAFATCQTAPLERPVQNGRPDYCSKRSFEDFDNVLAFEGSPVQRQVSTPVSKRSRSAFNTPGSATSAEYYEDNASLSPEMLWLPAGDQADVQGLGLAAAQAHAQRMPYMLSPTGYDSAEFLTSPHLDASFAPQEYLNDFLMPQTPLSPCEMERMARFEATPKQHHHQQQQVYFQQQQQRMFVQAPQIPSSPTNNRHAFDTTQTTPPVMTSLAAQRPRTMPQGSPLSRKAPGLGNRRGSCPSQRGGIPAGAAKELNFCNFTAADKKVILSGVAPSGSTKKPLPVATDMAIGAEA